MRSTTYRDIWRPTLRCGGTVRRAGAARVPGVNQDHGHTGQPGLVLDEGAQLVEGPVSQSCPLPLLGRNPLADTPEPSSNFLANPKSEILTVVEFKIKLVEWPDRA